MTWNDLTFLRVMAIGDYLIATADFPGMHISSVSRIRVSKAILSICQEMRKTSSIQMREKYFPSIISNFS